MNSGEWCRQCGAVMTPTTGGFICPNYPNVNGSRHAADEIARPTRIHLELLAIREQKP